MRTAASGPEILPGKVPGRSGVTEEALI